jgi:V/A-type H+-transporting ATPase subunit D
MSLFERVSATKGALLKARQQYQFIVKGKEILEMKRDRLAGDINQSLPAIRRRAELEEELIRVYEDAKRLIATIGYDEAASYAKAIKPMKTKLLVKSIMGVPEPIVKITEEPRLEAALNPYIQDLARRLLASFLKLLEVTQVEAKVEREALELMSVNRKVNALEKILIPKFQDLIRYIEERIIEEELEEFVKNKYIFTVLRGERL